MGVLAAGLAVVATACPPPPTGQQVPPGGRVVATSAQGTSLKIEDASDDLSRIVYGRAAQTTYDYSQDGGAYYLYDDAAGSTTELPFAREHATSVGISGDGATVVFSSPDPALQVGPTAVNCRRWNGLFLPLVPVYCAELYRYDPATGAVEQLTGLSGSSLWHNVDPEVSDDGSIVEYSVTSLVPESGSTSARMDIASGVVESLAYTPCCRWDRGDTIVMWDPSYQRLRSTDVATGQVTELLSLDGAELASSAANGRYVVLRDRVGAHHLVDTDTGDVRLIPGSWVDDVAETFAVVQSNVAPSGTNRLILAPLL